MEVHKLLHTTHNKNIFTVYTSKHEHVLHVLYLHWSEWKHQHNLVMVMWSPSSHQPSSGNHLTLHFDRVFAPSINVINTWSTFPFPIVVLRFVRLEHRQPQLDLRCCGEDRSLTEI